MIDSTRHEVFLCPDCSTQNMVTTVLPDYTEDGDGAVVAVVHDDSCPWLAALPEADRTQMEEHGAFVHFAASEVPGAAATEEHGP